MTRQGGDTVKIVLPGGSGHIGQFLNRELTTLGPWEATQEQADTPHTRKVALRAAMVMTPGHGGIFQALRLMTRLGLGGPVAGGTQFVSWIHGNDFLKSLLFLLDRHDLSGPINIAAPNPLPHRDFMRTLRSTQRIPFGLPATKWMAELGAFAIRSDTELLLKSRRVVPGRLLDAGFTFDYPHWQQAAADLQKKYLFPSHSANVLEGNQHRVTSAGTGT